MNATRYRTLDETGRQHAPVMQCSNSLCIVYTAHRARIKPAVHWKESF
jgi:hypothetical protein